MFSWILDRLNLPPAVNRVSFELWTLALMLMTGAYIALTGNASPAVITTLDPFFVFLWAGSFIIGPAIIFFALFMKNRLLGLYIEYYTLWPFGLMLMLYPAMSLASAGLIALVPAMGITICGLSCWTNALLIRHDLKRAGLWTPTSSEE